MQNNQELKIYVDLLPEEKDIKKLKNKKLYKKENYNCNYGGENIDHAHALVGDDAELAIGKTI